MPALLVHLTAARETARRKEAPPRLASALTEEEPAFLLGSILPDLPYHADFGHQVARHLLHRPYLHTEWGDLLHTRGTGRLALAFLTHLRRSHLPLQEERRVLALGAGYLSHHAMDRCVHPLIHRLVDRNLGVHALPPENLHNRLEHYQNVFFHEDRLGLDIAGSPYARRMVGQIAGAGLLWSRLEESLWLALRSALLETHGRLPSQRLIRDWLFGTSAYAHLFSSPLGRAERIKGDRKKLRAEFYLGPEVDLLTPLHQAMDLTVEYWRAAETVIEAERITSEVRSVFLQRVPDVDFSTGA
jgi:hypothetical protein